MRVHKDGYDWVAECKEHDQVIWCEHWIDALEAAFGHVAMYHPRVCNHEYGYIIDTRHRCLSCGVDLPPAYNLDTLPGQGDAS